MADATTTSAAPPSAPGLVHGIKPTWLRRLATLGMYATVIPGLVFVCVAVTIYGAVEDAVHALAAEWAYGRGELAGLNALMRATFWTLWSKNAHGDAAALGIEVSAAMARPHWPARWGASLWRWAMSASCLFGLISLLFIVLALAGPFDAVDVAIGFMGLVFMVLAVVEARALPKPDAV